MDTRNIQPDPCDNQIIRCHNLLQCLACIIEIAASLSGNEEFRDASSIIRIIADAVYYSVMACMTAQVAHELKAEESSGKHTPPAPVNMEMQRDVPSGAVQQFMVQVPAGVGPGGQFSVISPFNGQTVVVAVPPGVGPGATFPVSM